MREILFRGKRVDNGEWVEGYYVNAIGPNCEPNETRHYIVTYPGDWHEVYTSTVGQYTGLTDKNGLKKVFEGDIVLDTSEEWTWVIIFEDGTFLGADSVACYSDEELGELCSLHSGGFEGVRIIGNIHDNPDLLKSEVST